MLNALRLANFKSFRHTGEVHLAPVNLICGVNSSGKSSVIQSLLVLKQTLASPTLDEPLILNGSLVALGEYQDVHHFSAKKDDPIDIGVSVFFPSGAYLSDWWRSLESNYGKGIRQSGLWAERARGRSWQSQHNAYTMDVSVSIGRDRANHGHHILNSTHLKLNAENEWFQNFEFKLERDTQIFNKLRAEYSVPDTTGLFQESAYAVSRCAPIVDPADAPVACQLTSFLPWRGFVIDHSETDQVVNQFLESVLSGLNATPTVIDVEVLRHMRRRSQLSSNFHVASRKDDTFESRLRAAVQLYGPALQDALLSASDAHSHSEWQERFEQAKQKRPLINKRLDFSIASTSTETGRMDFDDALSDFTSFFSQMLYLGPLRDEPRAFYRRLGASDPTYVGERGENTAFVLKYYGQRDIPYVKPPEANAKWNPAQGEVTVKPLIQAVVQWLQYLGIANDIQVADVGKIGLAIRANVSGGKQYSDLTNVGVGVSQVLPLLVLGLVAPPGSTLLLEQPELHLHPYVQSRLADFFLSLNAVGKQVVAETHSEHLVYRMRYFMAKGDISPNDLTVYFFSLSRETRSSEIKRVHISPVGEIDDWPPGFFDETTKLLESIVDASFDRLLDGGNKR